MNPLQRLGENIRVARIRLKVSQDRLAEEAGLDRSYVGMIERGESSPTVIPLLKIARALGIELAELFAGLELDEES